MLRVPNSVPSHSNIAGVHMPHERRISDDYALRLRAEERVLPCDSSTLPGGKLDAF